MKFIKTLKIDINKNNYETVPSVEFDKNARFLHVYLLNNSVPFDLTGCSVKIYAIKADNTEIFNSCKTIDRKKGFIEIELTQQINAIAGNVECELKIYSVDGVLTTKTFIINISKSIARATSIISNNEYGALTDALNKVQGIDNKADRVEVEEKFNELNLKLDTIANKKIKYKEKQQILISNFQNKLIKGENVSIGLYGDSLTYGYDVTSDDRRENSVTDNAGNVYVKTIASKTYPEVFKETLNKVYGANKVTVTVRAIGGDYVKKALERWIPKKYPIATDICIMNYGVNDSRLASCEYAGDTTPFLNYYKELIETELDNGTAIILMTPFKMRTTDIKVQVFENAVINLAKEYEIPVIIGDEITANFPHTYYSDGTHFNGKGYEITGTKIANCFIGNGIFNPIKVSENTQLLTRRQLDGIWWHPNDDGIYNVAAPFYPTPAESGEGGIATRIGVNSTVYYTFYAEKDLWIAPFLGFNDESSYAIVNLDFAIDTPDFTFDNFPFLGGIVDFETRALSSVTYTSDMPKVSSRIHVGSILVDELPCLRTVTKGWHTISITAKGGSIGLGGLVFPDINYFETIRNRYTKFRNNIELKPVNATDYRDLTIYREDQEGLKSARFATNLRNDKVSASIFLQNESDKEIISEFALKDSEAICNKSVRLYPDNLTDALGFSTVRQFRDFIYYQNYGLFVHGNKIAVGSCLYDFNTKKELSRMMLGENSLSASKSEGDEIDLGTSYFKFKDIYSTNGIIQTSDLNFKKDIADIDIGLDFINKLRPVNFRFKDGASNRVHTGFLAQEVEKILKEDKALLVKEKLNNGNIKEGYALRYHELIAPLVKSVQELSKEIKELKNRES